MRGFAEEVMKIAKERKGLELAKVVGSGALGFGAGTAAGMGAGWLADKAYGKMSEGKTIPRRSLLLAAPLLGVGAGIAYALSKAKEQEALRRVVQDSTDSSGS